MKKSFEFYTENKIKQKSRTVWALQQAKMHIFEKKLRYKSQPWRSVCVDIISKPVMACPGRNEKNESQKRGTSQKFQASQDEWTDEKMRETHRWKKNRMYKIRPIDRRRSADCQRPDDEDSKTEGWRVYPCVCFFHSILFFGVTTLNKLESY